jgi:hypothetical protein
LRLFRPKELALTLLSPLLALLILFQPETNGLERFFNGRTEGRGSVKIMLSGTSAIQSVGNGRIEPNGTLVLDHVVRQAGEPERRRTWRMRRVSTGRYSGTISDGRGPVTGEIHGNRFHVTYRTKDGYGVDQWLTIDRGGRTASSRTTFSKLGVTVATAEERITKVN